MTGAPAPFAVDDSDEDPPVVLKREASSLGVTKAHYYY